MKYEGGDLTAAQIEAGLVVMRGEFAGTKVMGALQSAGVTRMVSATNALIGRELKAGRIARITRGLYRQC